MRYYRATFLLLAWLLCPWLASAQMLWLDPDVPMQATAGHWQRLDDASGLLDAAQADASPAWAPLPAHLNASFTSKAVWLRMSVQVQQPGSWMLVMGNALLDEVQVHVRRPGGPWQLLGRSGEDLERAAWPVDYRSPAFQFDPWIAGDYELLVRLRAQNALVTRIDLWQRLAFDNQTRREALSFGLYFGLYLLLIGVQLVFWLGTRAPLSGVFLVYISVCVLNEVLSLGLVQQLTGLPGFWSDRLLGCGIAAALAISSQLACGQLGLAALHPQRVRVLVQLLWLFSLCCMLSVLLGHYAAGMVPVQVLTLPLAVGFLVLALWLWRHGHAPARFFVLAFGIFYAGVVISFLRNLGWLPMNALTALVSTHASALGTMVHMLLLSAWIIGGHERRRRAREREQAHLEAELAQRQVRESELSEALALERRVRQEQRDFVAMVSHELRTPLAIIITSAQQLARNLTAPPDRTLARSHHIREAAQRLLALVDDCLAEDRMADPQPHAEPRLEPCDLHALVDGLCQDFPVGRIVCDMGEDARHLHTDAGLLRIAVRNLLANADRHTPEGLGVRLRLVRDGASVALEVSNPSEPIAPQDQAQLFERYYRGRNAWHRPGAGLGLYLVRRIAERLGGSVTLVTSGGEHPVCLRVVLPMTGP
ncbi:Signal-transduction histidine kinase senX3 [Delftia tsuruhatensis]|uniref:sensor histidine kinase n=1 Tax=Delftia tsuruhatensis TaxID=180282 RepID=UPI001E7A6928|nr:sensor histidine kinase [Delftia tsuruhatensis]CAB5710955.1 Signal-transduction histidine kinase senX3 [Delftia tsuruhatensis]CAC9692316.1 Signal-transduction histidine kinase senX3 [Delftia tsuruhatensis]